MPGESGQVIVQIGHERILITTNVVLVLLYDKCRHTRPAMRQAKKPSAAETAILTILWENQPCSVKTVHAHLKEKRGVGYTTVLKQVQRMLDKGLVSREQGQGRSFLYRATESEDRTKTDLYERFVQNAFGGSASELVMHALGNEKTSDAEIDAIKAFIAKLES